MKILFHFACVLFAIHVNGQSIPDSTKNRLSLDKATLALRNAFAKGDAKLVASLHHPDIIKYFGGDNVVKGRTALQNGLTELFKNSKLEFIENTVESTLFTGNLAIQTTIFSIKTTPKNGGKPVAGRGRAMVIYIRDKNSPTGWYSLREMAQAAPEENDALLH